MIYMLVGIQGSGKSTFANYMHEHKNMEVISTDEVRKTMNGHVDENVVRERVYAALAKAILENRDAIYDATNITIKVRKRYFEEMEKRGASPYRNTIAIAFEANVSECKKRVERRNQDKSELYLPLEVIDNYFEKYELPMKSEGFFDVRIMSNMEEDSLYLKYVK